VKQATGIGPGRPSTGWVGVAMLLAVLPLALAACTNQLMAGRCDKNTPCTGGQECNKFNRCVDVARADGGDARPGGTGERPPASEGGAGPEVGGVPGADGSGPEMAGPDGPGSCGVDDDCEGSAVCAAGRCVACTMDGHCGDPINRFCHNNACVDCKGAPADSCAQKAGDRRHCGGNGACVECLETTQCTAAGRGFCVDNACVGCAMAGADACKGTTPACDATSGSCVECTAPGNCKEAGKPFCAANKCVPCAMAPAGQTCATLNAALPACGPAGACVECNESADCKAAELPICQANRCVACTADAQCAAKLGASPGVCLAHQGGRCATEADTIHVRAGTGCGAAGTMAQPACSLDAARPLITGTRRLVLVHGLVEGFDWALPAGGPVSIIGKQSAVVSGGARIGARFTGTGEVYMRDMTVAYSMLQGIAAGPGTTLRLDRMTVQTNGGGGILLDHARFDIRHTLVTDNGPGQQGGQIPWGGIRIDTPPSEGPARLERVSAVSNRQVGISCSTRIEGAGVLASGNFGGVETTAACGLSLCPVTGASCGASVGSP
jgi:hypothetical protein